MTKILTQEEIDTLLQAVARGEILTVERKEEPRRDRTILPYDFRRPNRISKDQLRILQTLHDDFAKLLSSSLSAYLRSLVEIRLQTIGAMTFAEFLAWIVTPCCLGLFGLKPLRGEAAVAIDPHLVFALIDRLLGGTGRPSIPVREFTEIERAIIRKLIERYLVELQQAWSRIGTFQAQLLNIETNPQLVQIVSPNELVIVIDFEMKMGEVSGSVHLLLPVALLEPILPKLTASRWFSSAYGEPSKETSASVEAELMKTNLHLRAVLGEISVSVQELALLKEGHILRLNAGPGSLAVVEVEGVPRFLAKPGLSRGKRAVKITNLVQDGVPAHDRAR